VDFLRPPEEPKRDLTALWQILVAVSAAGITFFIVFLFLTTMSVMAHGSGSPTTAWGLMIPASIFVGMSSIFLNIWAVGHTGGLRLQWAAWTALFGLLGFGFYVGARQMPVGEGGAAMMVVAVVFEIMAFGPLIVIPWMRRSQDASGRLVPADLARRYGVHLLVNAIGILVGAAGAIAVFGAVAGWER
jgi:hypothetical protein